MAYKATDWTDILSPFLRGIEGDTPLTSSFDELPWLEDEQQLDPFTTQFDAEVQRFTGTADSQARQRLQSDSFAPTAVKARESFKLPMAATRGDAQADRIAASKGVDPGTHGGTGKMIDLAKTMIGVPYVFGAYSPGTAFDCSGFTKWAYSRALGVALPHSAESQAASLPNVKREDLQPGDLVFFSYGRKGPGVVDHVEIYMGNGKMIGTANTTDDLDIDNVDWSNFVQGGRPESVATVETSKRLTGAPGTKGQSVKQAPVRNNQTLVPMALSDGPPAFSMVMDSILTPDSVPAINPKKSFRGVSGSTDKQLYQGFIDAGRPDLARMVGTKDFRTWLNQESGYDPTRVSQPYDGVRNYGMFQFRGHDWESKWITDNGNTWTASAYEQAKLVAKYFGHLTPKAIHEYAAQIRAGNYHGWG